jgi:hypothetical protein
VLDAQTRQHSLHDVVISVGVPLSSAKHTFAGVPSDFEATNPMYGQAVALHPNGDRLQAERKVHNTNPPRYIRTSHPPSQYPTTYSSGQLRRPPL